MILRSLLIVTTMLQQDRQPRQDLSILRPQQEPRTRSKARSTKPSHQTPIVIISSKPWSSSATYWSLSIRPSPSCFSRLSPLISPRTTWTAQRWRRQWARRHPRWVSFFTRASTRSYLILWSMSCRICTRWILRRPPCWSQLFTSYLTSPSERKSSGRLSLMSPRPVT